MASNIKKNLGLQTLYQLLNTILPLITAPYIARVLGASQIGVFSYTSSVVSYFSLVAMLGTINYGTRSIAVVRENRIQRNRIFWEIYSLQFLMSTVACIIYAGYLFFVNNENNIIATIQLLVLVGCYFDISWLFFGLENFKLTVTRSVVIRIATVISILIFVKNPSDLWIYSVLMIGGTILSQMFLWLYLPKYIAFYRPKIKDILVHIKPNLILFIPLLAMSVYHSMDKTMLGLLSDYEQSGFYYNADKLINIPMGIINGVGTVMLPRMTALYSSGNKIEANKVFLLSTEGIACVSSAMAFGIAAVSNEFIPFFFGGGYEGCILLTILLAPVLIIKGLSNTARTQYLVPLKMESVFTYSVFIGAVTNLILNIIFIPNLGAVGAVIGTLLAEFVSCFCQYIYMNKILNLKRCFLNCIIYLGFGIIMFLIVRVVSVLQLSVLLKLIIEICIGFFSYGVFCFIFWRHTKNYMYKIIFSSYLSKLFNKS